MLGAELRTACRLGSLLWAPTISTCQAAAGGGCVFIFRSSSGPHDPVQHHTHTHSLTHTHSHKQWDIHSNPQKGGLSRRKKQPPLSAARMETKICMLPLSLSLSVSLSLSLSLCPNPLSVCGVVFPVRRSSGALVLRVVWWRSGGGVSDVPLLVLPVSSLIVHRLHPLAN